jgi:hypothetical protein
MIGAQRVLLAGGQSLILGPSLQELDKDEVVHDEADIEDRPLFDEEWDEAAPLPSGLSAENPAR